MRYARSAKCVLMGAALAAPNAYAQSQTSIGVLTCTSGAGIEGKGDADNPNQMTCGFKPTGSGAEQRYSGTFKIRTERGRTGGQASTHHSALGAVMVLTGKSNNAISLQAETAGGVAGAPVEVELKLLATPA